MSEVSFQGGGYATYLQLGPVGQVNTPIDNHNADLPLKKMHNIPKQKDTSSQQKAAALMSLSEDFANSGHKCSIINQPATQLVVLLGIELARQLFKEGESEKIKNPHSLDLMQMLTVQNQLTKGALNRGIEENIVFDTIEAANKFVEPEMSNFKGVLLKEATNIKLFTMGWMCEFDYNQFI